MTTIKEYRGTKEFYRVLKECIAVAEHRGVLYYKDVADFLPGVSQSGNHMSMETAAMSGAISKEMNENGFPMLSAVIVRTTDEVPGEGFYTFAHELDVLERDPETMTQKEKRDFWGRELEQVYEFWE